MYKTPNKYAAKIPTKSNNSEGHVPEINATIIAIIPETVSNKQLSVNTPTINTGIAINKTSNNSVTIIPFSKALRVAKQTAADASHKS